MSPQYQCGALTVDNRMETPTRTSTAVRKLQALNRRDLDALLSSYADPFTLVDHAQGRTMRTRDEVEAWLMGWFRAIPTGRVTVRQTVDRGDTVVAQITFSGIAYCPSDTLMPTGRYVSVDVCIVYRFDGTGRIAFEETYYDRSTLFGAIAEDSH